MTTYFNTAASTSRTSTVAVAQVTDGQPRNPNTGAVDLANWKLAADADLTGLAHLYRIAGCTFYGRA